MTFISSSDHLRIYQHDQIHQPTSTEWHFQKCDLAKLPAYVSCLKLIDLHMRHTPLSTLRWFLNSFKLILQPLILTSSLHRGQIIEPQAWKRKSRFGLNLQWLFLPQTEFDGALRVVIPCLLRPYVADLRFSRALQSKASYHPPSILLLRLSSTRHQLHRYTR